MGLFNLGKKKKTPAEMYLQHMENIFHQEPEFYKEESLMPGAPGVTTFVYRDIPKPGHIVGITYGLSLVKHPNWKYGRAELLICVDSSVLNWATVAGYIANKLRGDCPFSYGQTINFGQRISDDSEMDAFFMFAPSILDKKDAQDIDVGLDYKVNLIGLYPMYSDEMEAYEQLGLKDFWHHPDYDNYSVKRKRVTK